MKAALTISRFTIPHERVRECEPMLGSVPEQARSAPGFLSSSVWRLVSEDQSFFRLTIFDGVETMDAFYDGISKSDGLLDAIRNFGVVPDVIRMSIDSFHHFDPRRIHESEFMSFSLRALDPGYGPEWAEKLGNNFEEVSTLPGFEGALVSTGLDVDERVAGFAFWQTVDSFRRSVPDNPDYAIDLYKLYR